MYEAMLDLRQMDLLDVPWGCVAHHLGLCQEVRPRASLLEEAVHTTMQNKKLMRSLAGGRATRSNEETKAGEWFSSGELEAAREAYLEEQQQDAPDRRVKHRYAVALVKSNKRDDKLRGIGLLEDLLTSGFETKECLYWLALTSYSLGEYRTSRAHCEKLLRLEPTHARALALHQCIKDVTVNDQIMGLGLVSAVVVAGIAIKLLLKR